MNPLSEIGYITIQMKKQSRFIICFGKKNQKSHISSSNDFLLEASRARFRRGA